MKIQISKPTKFAAGFFFFGAVLNTFRGLMMFVSPEVASEEEALRSAIGGLIQMLSLFFGIISVILSLFLWKGKRWAYLAIYTFVIGSLCLHGLTLVTLGDVRVIGLILSIAVLIGLIKGKEDFRKEEKVEVS